MKKYDLILTSRDFISKTYRWVIVFFTCSGHSQSQIIFHDFKLPLWRILSIWLILNVIFDKMFSYENFQVKDRFLRFALSLSSLFCVFVKFMALKFFVFFYNFDQFFDIFLTVGIRHMVHSSIANKNSDSTDEYARNIKKKSRLSKINNIFNT